MNIKKGFIIVSAVVASLFLSVSSASAHVTVTPNEVGVGKRVNFVVSVPTEEVDPTVQLRLVVPEGLQSVTPNVKPGWTIELKKTGEGDAERVSEIIWSGGSIPAEQRDEFVFRAQAPAEEMTLVWKAYQTYANGEVVAWEHSSDDVEAYEKDHPSVEGEDDHAAPRPYSETKVVNDLVSNTAIVAPSMQSSTNASTALVLSLIALVVSGIALWKVLSKKR